MPRFRDPQTIKMPGSKGRIIYYESGNGWRREVFAGRRTRLPDMPIVGQARYRRAVDHLPEHIHQQSFEICRIESGHLDWTIKDRVYSLSPGDIFWTAPREIHGGVNSMLQPCVLFWVQIFEGDRRSGSTCPTTQQLLKTLAQLGVYQFRGDEACRECFEALLKEEKKSDDLSSLSLRLALNQLLIAVIRAASNAVAVLSDRQAPRISPAIQLARAEVCKNWRQPLDVANLAQIAGLRRSQFLRRFSEEVGQTPAALRQGILLEQAKQFLRNTQQPITSLALDLGISSSQYFATWFHQHTGLSPLQYRQGSKTAVYRNGKAGPKRTAGADPR